MSRTMHRAHRRHGIRSAALALAAAGWGAAGGARPPLPLDETNATAVAAEALVTLGQNSFSVRLPSGVTAGAAGLRRLGPGLARRLIAAVTGPQSADGTR